MKNRVDKGILEWISCPGGDVHSSTEAKKSLKLRSVNDNKEVRILKPVTFTFSNN